MPTFSAVYHATAIVVNSDLSNATLSDGGHAILTVISAGPASATVLCADHASGSDPSSWRSIATAPFSCHATETASGVAVIVIAGG